MIKISIESMRAFSQAVDQNMVKVLVNWALSEIPWAIDTKDNHELSRRVKLTIEFGRLHGLSTSRELGMLFGALSINGPKLASNEEFRHTLAAFTEPQRVSMLRTLISNRAASYADSLVNSGDWMLCLATDK
jgi:hypothetical protein